MFVGSCKFWCSLFSHQMDCGFLISGKWTLHFLQKWVVQ